MERKVVLVALALAVLLACAGCGMTPQQKMYAATRTYTAVVLLCVEARRTGAIESDATWEALQKLDAVAHTALNDYIQALDAGLPGTAEWAAFNAAIDKFLEMYQRLPEPKAKKEPATVEV